MGMITRGENYTDASYEENVKYSYINNTSEEKIKSRVKELKNKEYDGSITAVEEKELMNLLLL